MSEIISRESAVSKSLEYFNGDSLAANVFVDKYALKDSEGHILESTPDEMHDRMASEFARIESKYPNPISYETIRDAFDKFGLIVPQGSPMEGIGNNHRITSLSNCYVIESPVDSYGGIFKADQQEAQLMKRRGGVGMDISHIRPKGMTTNNAAKTTDGIAVFMDRFSNTCREVAQNGRRGALMLTIDVRHPEVETFINIKRDKSRVTGANISVKLTDSFMTAVKNNDNYIQQWPIESPNPSITIEVNAREIWEQIVDAAWTSAEPGLLFWDNAKNNTPSDCYADVGFGSTSTNPCGEIVLSPGDSCRLISLNLFGFVNNPFGADSSFNEKKFAKYVYIAQKLMDDMIDLELEKLDQIIEKIKADPENESVKREELELWTMIRTRCEQGRRTGLGITALGDTLAALGMKYGSPESLDMTEKIYKALAVNAYRATIDMAAERGAFTVFDYHKEKMHGFLNQVICELGPEYVSKWRTSGRRNIALTTTAPTGTVSIMTQTTSGIEPCFQPVYKRRKKVLSSEDKVDFVDVNGDKWTEFEVCHHNFATWRDVTGLTNVEDSPYYKATANDVDWTASVELQARAQKWICHSISKTCNLPNSATKELVSEIYLTAWESGCKGFTVYRDGCRDGVLITGNSEKKSEVFETKNAPKRPEELTCDINQVKIKNEGWTVLVGLMEDKPYEIFAGRSKFVSIPKKVTSGKLIKHPKFKGSKKSAYDLRFGDEQDPLIIKDIAKVFENPTEGEFTRMISLSLRHGAPVQYIVDQLQKDEESDMYSFSKVIARVLKKYIAEGVESGETCPDCGAKIVYIEGCKQCSAKCGWGKCG